MPINSPLKLRLFILLLLIAAASSTLAAKPFNPAPYFAPENFVEVRGAQICYIDNGQGDPIILVHGWAGNIWNWMSVFDKMAENRRVIALDLPGHGKSGCPEDFDYSMPAYADFLAEFMDKIGVDHATLAGSSMGGAITAWAAILHQDRVSRLILIDAAGTSVQNPLMKAAGFLMTDATVIPLIHAVFPVNDETTASVPDSEKKRVELAEQLYASDRKKCAAHALFHSMRSMGRDITDSRLSEITSPTLIIWGSDDGLLPLEAGQLYREKIPGAKMVVIEGGNHTPMQWQPDAFLTEVEKFLNPS